jgi:hypothetical protein
MSATAFTLAWLGGFNAYGAGFCGRRLQLQRRSGPGHSDKRSNRHAGRVAADL